MIQADDFVRPALGRGYRFWTGVPCSFLTPFINYTLRHPDLTYVGASSEGEAVAIALGAHLGGRRTVVLCQNSGLGNAVNPLTSLNYPFRIPTLLVVTHRGAPGAKDEPQHELMGLITGDLLRTMRIPWESFPQRADQVEATLEKADRAMSASGLPYALLMPKDAVSECLWEPKSAGRPAPEILPQGAWTVPWDRRMLRLDVLRAVVRAAGDRSALVATTGKTGRELFGLGHRPNQFYVVGGMGCASGIALGLSLVRERQKVVVLDGDGAALMKMGTLATIGHCRPRNLVHVLIDNEAHESTGGQATVSGSIDFARIASACAYPRIGRADTETALTDLMEEALMKDGPALIHVKVRPGSDPRLGRPTLSPVQIKEQFMEYLAQ